MRVLIIHNPAAGKSTRRGSAIVRAFKDAGHTVWYRSTGTHRWIKSLDDAIDVVVTVGGDGTVAQVVRELSTRSPRQPKPPLSILPFGTANNVARSFGLRANATHLARNLERAVPTTLRVIRVRSEWGERLAVESAGIGVFPQLFREANERVERAKRRNRKPPRAWSVPQARQRLMHVVETATPHFVRVTADGEDASGEYLLVEALNIGRIGPRALLSRTADGADLRMDLLLVGKKQRGDLLDYLASSDEELESPLEPLRVRQTEIDWPADDGHVDDMLWPTRRRRDRGTSARVTLETDPWLTLWVPPPRGP